MTGCRWTLLILVAAAGAECALAEPTTIDSLISRARFDVESERYDAADSLIARANELGAPAARIEMEHGIIAAARGDTVDAALRFGMAERLDPHDGHAEYGKGVLALHRGDRAAAEQWFAAAYHRNHHNADASEHVAHEMDQRGDWDLAKGWYHRALDADSLLPAANLGLANLLDNEGHQDDAIPYFERYLRVRQGSPEILTKLGMCYYNTGAYWQARQRFIEALARATGRAGEMVPGPGGLAPVSRAWKAQMLLDIAATYLGSREFDLADDTYRQALAALPPQERSYYDDISYVASPKQIAEYDALPWPKQRVFVERFWRERDVTPATAVNECLLEHYRRVWYSRMHYSRDATPWDNRGDVYVRYGPPQYTLRKGHPNFAMSRDVDRVRTDYEYRLYGRSRPEPTGDPIYPVSPLGFNYGVADWEEWVYTNVGRGLVILFTDQMGFGAYTFAKPQYDRGENLVTASPGRLFESEVESTPQTYTYEKRNEQFRFAYSTAQFRAPAGKTELDVYYGLPVHEMEFQSRTNKKMATISRGVAVFDTSWGVISRDYGTIRYLWTPGTPHGNGAVQVDRQSLVLDGGRNVTLGVQVQDRTSGHLGAFEEPLTIDHFDSVKLALSDIVVAGSIREVGPDSTNPSRSRFVRHGLEILPMASRHFRVDQPVFVYVEIYNLKRGGEFDRTKYAVEHAVRVGASRRHGGLFGTVGALFGGRRTVAVSNIVRGHSRNDEEHFELDTRSLGAGSWTLVVTVHDLISGETASRECPFVIDR